MTIRDLFVDSLRMRPDRIVVGEIRRGEALDLVQSMISGHAGSLTTVHATTAYDAAIRLETLSLMSDVALPVHVARTQVASAIQLVVQIGRFLDGSRKIRAISECLGLDDKGNYRFPGPLPLRGPRHRRRTAGCWASCSRPASCRRSPTKRPKWAIKTA